MAKITIKDLPKEEKVTKEELKRIIGGRGFDGFYFKIGSKTRRPRAAGAPCYDQTFCY